MDQFDIQGSTSSQLADNIKKETIQYSDNNTQIEEYEKVQDSFDLINCILAVVFKIFAILLYLLLKLLTDNYLGTFIGTVLLISIDFWVTKNLTGRKLVGLRWWSQINENDQQQWIFQSRNPKRIPHSVNENVFWISQLVFSLFWAVILLINIISVSLFWIGLGVFSTLLPFINLSCYFKCRGQHRKKVQQFTAKFGIKMGSQLF